MSAENVEVLQRFNDAFNRRDLASVLGCCDPDIEVNAGSILIGTPTYRGHGGIERLFRDMVAAWEELQAETLEVLAVGDNEVVAVGGGSGRGKTTGAPFEARMAVLIRFTRGKVVYVEWFATNEEALEAAGLSE